MYYFKTKKDMRAFYDKKDKERGYKLGKTVKIKGQYYVEIIMFK